MTNAEWILIAELVASAWMAALIWVVQLLVYPAFALVPDADWPAHHARHSTRVTWLVLPPMLVQLAAPLALLSMGESTAVPTAVLGALFGLAALTWVLTAAMSAPSHRRLSAGCSDAELRRLLRGNWIRTAAWSGLGVLAVVALATELIQ